MFKKIIGSHTLFLLQSACWFLEPSTERPTSVPARTRSTIMAGDAAAMAMELTLAQVRAPEWAI